MWKTVKYKDIFGTPQKQHAVTKVCQALLKIRLWLLKDNQELRLPRPLQWTSILTLSFSRLLCTEKNKHIQIKINIQKNTRQASLWQAPTVMKCLIHQQCLRNTSVNNTHIDLRAWLKSHQICQPMKKSNYSSAKNVTKSSTLRVLQIFTNQECTDMANIAKCIPVKNVASEVMNLETLKNINRTITNLGQIKLHKDQRTTLMKMKTGPNPRKCFFKKTLRINSFSIATTEVLKRCMNINLIFMLNETILSNQI